MTASASPSSDFIWRVYAGQTKAPPVTDNIWLDIEIAAPPGYRLHDWKIDRGELYVLWQRDASNRR